MNDNQLLIILTTSFDFWQSFFVFIPLTATRPSAGRRGISFRPRPRHRSAWSWCSCARAVCWWCKGRPPRAFGSALVFFRPGNSGKGVHDCPFFLEIRHFSGITHLYCPKTFFDWPIFVSAGVLSHNDSGICHISVQIGRFYTIIYGRRWAVDFLSTQRYTFMMIFS